MFGITVKFAQLEVPILDWLPAYKWKQDFVSDLNAGVTVFLLLIPQGMAYAVLAGMPPVYGLYTATIPLLVYALLGTSRQLSLGPFAITSLLLGNTCSQYGFIPGSPEYIQIVSTMSMIAGMISIALGFLQMGALANFLSQSVLTGFITASACVITLSQMKYILGIPTPRFPYTHQTIIYLLSHLHEINTNALWIGVIAITCLYGAKRWKQKNKPQGTPTKLFRVILALCNIASLIAILIGIVAAYLLIRYSSTSNGSMPIAVVGNVPSGLLTPGFSFALHSVHDVIGILPGSFVLSIIGFTGNWAVASRFAKQNKYKCSATQELLASGFCNVLGVFFNGFFASGGLARSAVNAESGARTQLAGIITSILIMISLMSLTSLFYYIPMAILGSIIIVSVISMMDFDQFVRAYRSDKRDWAVMMSTFVCTFFLGISEGIALGVLLSMSIVLYTASFPRIVSLGKVNVSVQTWASREEAVCISPIDDVASPVMSDQLLAGDATACKKAIQSLRMRSGTVLSANSEASSVHWQFRDISRYPSALQLPGIAMLRMDAALFFANADHFRNTLLDASSGKFHHDRDVPIQLVIVDISAWVDADLVGIDTVLDATKELNAKKISLALIRAHGHIRDQFLATSFKDTDMANCLHCDRFEDVIEAFHEMRRSHPSCQQNIDVERGPCINPLVLQSNTPPFTDSKTDAPTSYAAVVQDDCNL